MTHVVMPIAGNGDAPDESSYPYLVFFSPDSRSEPTASIQEFISHQRSMKVPTLRPCGTIHSPERRARFAVLEVRLDHDTSASFHTVPSSAANRLPTPFTPEHHGNGGARGTCPV